MNETAPVRNYTPDYPLELNPMTNLRELVMHANNLPFGTEEAEREWDAYRRVVDAYGADVLASVAVNDVVSIPSLEVTDFPETTSRNISAYYEAYNANLTRKNQGQGVEYIPEQGVFAAAKRLVKRCVLPFAA